MLSQSDVPIELVSSKILKEGYDVSFIVPTETAMKKSIMDAHSSLRNFLKDNNIHVYESQQQGVKYKIEVLFIGNKKTKKTMMSMYRPKTKMGDPRIWIYGLSELAMPYNLLGIIYVDNCIYIVNCSDEENLSFALAKVLPKVTKSLNPIASELLDRLTAINKLGFIPTIVSGDTGVGMTLEHCLGLPANSNKLPDYKGIELKATRVDQNLRQRNKKQLFSKTPKWELSPIGTAENLVIKRGYVDKLGDRALRHTISGAAPNSLGLYLDIDYANDYLRQMFKENMLSPEHDMTWLLDDLKKALLKKHKETFWVKAYHNNDRNNEKFHYVSAQYTSNPYINKLETLLETGLVTLDYTLHLKPSGKARDHGYLFKLKANSLEALFPRPIVFDLSARVL